jgi:predicted 2-oxoglutarate/Fe(II)-dependent dioxygenase YbiX
MTDLLETFQMYVRREMLAVEQCRGLIDTVESEGSWFDYELPADQVGNAVRQQFQDLRHPGFRDLHEFALTFLRRLNAENWGFVIDGWQQPLRIAKYQPGYRHDWHTDYTGTDASKLAFSMPLNDGYTGGELQLLESERIEQRVGHAVVFPAFQGHRVTEVTGGVRYVLLGWLTGPRFV